MPKYFCDYCDVYLTHDSQGGRKQHSRGRRHQENVRIFYTAFLRAHVQYGEPASHSFAPVPLDKQGQPRCQGALPPAPGEGRLPFPGGRGLFPIGSGEGLAAFGLGGGGPIASVIPGAVLLIQPSSIPRLRDAEPVRDEDVAALAAAQQTAAIPINVPPPMRGGGFGAPRPPLPPPPPPPQSSQPSQPLQTPPSLPQPPFPPARLPLPPPPFPRPPPPPPPAGSAPTAASSSTPQPPHTASSWPGYPPSISPYSYSSQPAPSANGYGSQYPPPLSAPPPAPAAAAAAAAGSESAAMSAAAARGPTINPERMRALGLQGLR